MEAKQEKVRNDEELVAREKAEELCSEAKKLGGKKEFSDSYILERAYSDTIEGLIKHELIKKEPSDEIIKKIYEMLSEAYVKKLLDEAKEHFKHDYDYTGDEVLLEKTYKKMLIELARKRKLTPKKTYNAFHNGYKKLSRKIGIKKRGVPVTKGQFSMQLTVAIMSSLLAILVALAMGISSLSKEDIKAINCERDQIVPLLGYDGKPDNNSSIYLQNCIDEITRNVYDQNSWCIGVKEKKKLSEMKNKNIYCLLFNESEKRGHKVTRSYLLKIYLTTDQKTLVLNKKFDEAPEKYINYEAPIRNFVIKEPFPLKTIYSWKVNSTQETLEDYIKRNNIDENVDVEIEFPNQGNWNTDCDWLCKVKQFFAIF